MEHDPMSRGFDRGPSVARASVPSARLNREEQAVPALFRAEQVIVSGDQMQLPPTNFFSAARPAGEDVLLPGEDEEDAAPVRRRIPEQP